MYPTTLKHILVPVDFSELAGRAVAAAAAVAKDRDAEMVLLHVIEIPTWSTLNPSLVSLGDLMATLEREAERQLTAMATSLAEQGARVAWDIRQGSPRFEILRYVTEKRPDLVVICTHGRTGLAHAAMGSVAERIVQRSVSPVLVLPAHGS